MPNNRSYPLIANSNYESRDDEVGIAVHEARLAATRQHRWCDDSDLIDALDSLEAWIDENCESDDAEDLAQGRQLDVDIAQLWRDLREADLEYRYDA